MKTNKSIGKKKRKLFHSKVIKKYYVIFGELRAERVTKMLLPILRVSYINGLCMLFFLYLRNELSGNAVVVLGSDTKQYED